MDFDLTSDQQELRSTVRRVLESRASDPDRRAVYDGDSGYDADLWALLSRSMGLAGLVVEEKQGGSGAGLLDLSVVLAEMGRVALSSPYFATVVLAGSAIAASPAGDVRDALLQRLAAGDLTATLAEADAHETSASESAGVWRLTGAKRLVVDAGPAQVLLVSAATSQGTALFAVDADQVVVTGTPSLDPTRRLSRVVLDGAVGELLAEAGLANSVLDHVHDITRVALAAENLGGAQRCLDMAVDHALSRQQFGRPIGSFQAVKHHCADMLVEIQSAQAAVDYAAWAHDHSPEEFPTVAALAASVADDSYLDVTKRTIQVHGGMGFTWEHPAHYYFKRAKSGAILFGTAAAHREALATRIGL